MISKTRFTLMLFVLLSLVQLSVPAWMIVSRERTLRSGRAFKFRITAIEQYDPLRGSYLALQVHPSRASFAEAIPSGSRRAFALLKEDDHGFATVSSLTGKRPPGTDFVEVKVTALRLSSGARSKKEVLIEWPFQRYYLEEGEIDQIKEGLDQETVHDGTCVVVRVRQGDALAERLLVKNQPSN